jgi:hypothetical protein
MILYANWRGHYRSIGGPPQSACTAAAQVLKFLDGRLGIRRSDNPELICLVPADAIDPTQLFST